MTRVALSAGALLAPLAFLTLGCSGAKSRPNVVLIVVDSLRADALGCYGADPSPSAAIDALARDGARFERAIAQASWNVPSISSLLTSSYPSRHSMDAGTEGIVTLAETFHEAGYRTAAFVEATWPLLERGFTTVQNTSLKHLYGDPEANSARTTMSAAAAWLTTKDDAPALALVHTYETHSYFLGKPRHHAAARQALPGYDGPFKDWQVRDTSGAAGNEIIDALLGANEDDLAYVRALYEAAVAETDAAIAELVATLKKAGLEKNTVLVVTSSNGEGFRPDLKRVHHGGRLHDDLLHVPLVVSWPGHVDPAVGRSLVEAIDVAPSLARLAGLPEVPPHKGRALLQAEEGFWARLRGARFGLAATSESPQALAEETALRVLPNGQREASTTRQAALYSGWLTLIDAGDHVELYDLKTDPQQEKNLCTGYGGTEALEHARHATSEAEEDDTAAGLESLGYLEGAVSETDENLCGAHSDAVRALYGELRELRGDVTGLEAGAGDDVTDQLRSLGYVQ